MRAQDEWVYRFRGVKQHDNKESFHGSTFSKNEGAAICSIAVEVGIHREEEETIQRLRREAIRDDAEVDDSSADVVGL